MKKRMLSILLVVALCIGVFAYIPAPVSALTVTDDQIVSAVLVIFRCKEGTYDSVNRNDNGALSVGKLQWHGARALDLLKNIASSDPATAHSVLGGSLYQEIVSSAADAWSARTLSASEGAKIRSLLGTETARSVQDAVGRKDIMGYISNARTAGIESPEAIVYYCDLQNQYGPGGAANLLTKIKAQLGKFTIDSLDELHNTLLQVTTNYQSRRNWTYTYCSVLDWNNIGAASYFTYALSLNLDLQPPEITDAEVICQTSGAFRVELKATDNKDVTDCRVEVSSDVESDRDWAGYAAKSGKIWGLRVSTKSFSPAATRYYITVTASDASGNGTSAYLEVSQAELIAAQNKARSCNHLFAALYVTEATCVSAGYRVERCVECDEIRRIPIAPAKGHRFYDQACPRDMYTGGQCPLCLQGLHCGDLYTRCTSQKPLVSCLAER